MDGDGVVDVAPLWMMVCLLAHDRGFGHEPEGLHEIDERELAVQRPFDDGPIVMQVAEVLFDRGGRQRGRDVHVVESCGFSMVCA